MLYRLAFLPSAQITESLEVGNEMQGVSGEMQEGRCEQCKGERRAGLKGRGSKTDGPDD